jgi:zinc transporter ZupT
MNTDKIYAESIVNEYSIKNDSKVVALRKLDAKVKGFPLTLSITIGVISSLVLGTGMCLSMGIIGSNSVATFTAGIIIGIIGMIGMAVNYPIYQRVLNNRKNMYASDILRLAKEIAQES